MAKPELYKIVIRRTHSEFPSRNGQYEPCSEHGLYLSFGMATRKVRSWVLYGTYTSGVAAYSEMTRLIREYAAKQHDPVETVYGPDGVEVIP